MVIQESLLKWLGRATPASSKGEITLEVWTHALPWDVMSTRLHTATFGKHEEIACANECSLRARFLAGPSVTHRDGILSVGGALVHCRDFEVNSGRLSLRMSMKFECT